MAAIQPRYLKMPSSAGHDLTDEEYAALISIINREMVLETTGTIYTTTTGEIYYEE